MATASRTEKIVRLDTVTLVLSLEEAQTLEAIGWRTGGHPTRSARGHMDEIWSALHKAGVRSDNNFLLTEGSSIQFKDRPGSTND